MSSNIDTVEQARNASIILWNCLLSSVEESRKIMDESVTLIVLKCATLANRECSCAVPCISDLALGGGTSSCHAGAEQSYAGDDPVLGSLACPRHQFFP